MECKLLLMTQKCKNIWFPQKSKVGQFGCRGQQIEGNFIHENEENVVFLCAVSNLICSHVFER